MSRLLATEMTSQCNLAGNFNRVLNESYDLPTGEFYARAARGAWIEDLGGRRYIDLALASGTAILGHAAQPVVEAICCQAELGSVFTVPNPATHRFSEILHGAMPWFSHFVLASSGSEATLRAIRLARAVSGKRKIGIFSGCWHGSHDAALVEEDYAGPEERPRAILKSGGTLPDILDAIIFLPYNHAAAFDLIRQHRHELAAVLIEPAQGSNPRDDVADFLAGLREVTRDNNVLLCFDEVITGARLALGGAQERYGIKADMAAYGKILGGGLPIGIVGGTPEIMSAIRCGGADGMPVFMGGTFSANPLTVAAGLAALGHLTEHRVQVYGHLDSMASRLRRTVNEFCAENRVPARMIGVGSMLRLLLTDRPVSSRRQRDLLEPEMAIQKGFYAALREKGVYIGSNRIIFLSVAHGPDEITSVEGALMATLGDWRNRLFQTAE